MFDDTQKLEISQKELELIEAALHTQSKILGVEANAGGSQALRRLNDVKRVLATISQQKRTQRSATRVCPKRSAMARLFG